MAGHSPTEQSEDIALRAIESNSRQTVQAEVSDEGAGSALVAKVIIQLIATGFSYFFAGANDGSLGALTPYILRTYDIGTQYIAIMYATV